MSCLKELEKSIKSMLSVKPDGIKILDRLELVLRWRLRSLEYLLQDKVAARKALLDTAANDRDREIYSILIKQSKSTRGNRSGRRKSMVTQKQDNTLLDNYNAWKERRGALGSDRQFSMERHHTLTGKDATDDDIRRITKQLRDALKRYAARGKLTAEKRFKQLLENPDS